MRWPVGRPTTVRTRIVALALAPAVALMALWSFAMVSVTSELRALIRLQGVYEDFGTPVDTAIGQIQIERRLSAAYLGGRLDTTAAGDLLGQQRRTDRAVDAMRQAVQGGDRDRLTGRQRQALDTMVAATGKLEKLREGVLSRHITWDRAVDEYSALVEPGFDVQSTLTALQAGQLAREAQVVVELVRVREFVSREDALVAGARAAGSLTDQQYDSLTATIEDRRVFERTYVPDLPADSRGLFEEFQRGDLHRTLVGGEDRLLRAGAAGAGRAVAADSWRSTSDRAVKRYMQLCTRSAENSAVRGRAFAYRELIKAGVVGVVGLAAVALSLWLAVRGARRISRRLETLRDAADLLSSRQLPDVMRRLSAGEEVDALAEAPPLADDGDRDDEIGQVGRSFNTARLAAVEAAVRQAGLRRGLFAVLLNIARRNQALVHRQLKLVDTLERRTEDPDVLQQLFRIDHLTTRMRRHAESLIILSGATPGRRWRRPVPVADVVASAVSEIEDYARVVVPPMPEVGVAADAVADVVHLLAELLENATVFSPPHTQVTFRTGRVGNGFVLEIDDRGLGLDAEQRAEAQRTLTDPDAFDPTRHDRLGLYVVGRLAARHGIEVSLTDSPYGGTTAVVLLPDAVLAQVEPAGAASGGAAVLEDAGAAGEDAPAVQQAGAAVRELVTYAPEAVEREAPVLELPSRRRSAPRRGDDPERAARDMPGELATDRAGHDRPALRAPDLAGHERPALPAPDLAGHDTPAPSATAADEAGADLRGVSAAPDLSRRDAPAPSATAADEAGADMRDVSAAPDLPRHDTPVPDTPALPTRTRQASLARELRDDPPPRDAAPRREVDADEMRAIFGAFQRGLDRGRKGLPTPADTDNAPADAHHAPADTGHVLTGPHHVPTDPGRAPADTGHVPSGPHHVPADTGHVPTGSHHVPTDPHRAPADTDHAPAGPHHLTSNADEGMDTDDVR